MSERSIRTVIEKIQFAADHYAPVEPRVMGAMLFKSGQEDEPSYGGDTITKRVEGEFQKTFGSQTKTYLVAGGGTAANVLALQAMVDRHQAIICTDDAHMNKHEAGAHALFTNAVLLPVPSTDAKLSTEEIGKLLYRTKDPHYSNPKVVSITQPTERGTVYKVDEIREIVKLAHDNGLYVHMDGARIFNAADALNKDLASFTSDLGVDVVSMGAGKTGGFGFGDAVVFINPSLAVDFENKRKQAAQLLSKMRYLSVQWLPILGDGLGIELAGIANDRTASLLHQIQGSSNIQITTPVETNGIWTKLKPKHIKKLSRKYEFELWDDPANHEVRFMTSYAHTQEQINELAVDITGQRQLSLV